MFKNKKFFIVLSVIVVGIIFIFWMSRDSRSDKGEVQTKETQSKGLYTQDSLSTYSKDRIDSYVVDDVSLSLDAFRDNKEALAGLLLINHINCAVTRIKNANDAFVLEEEYNSINQNAILLDVIKDPEIIKLISDIMDTIVSMRIEEKEREFLKDELEQGMSDAMYDAIPNPMNMLSTNPISMICNIATTAASSYMNYKRAKANLSRKFKRANWELDKNRMSYLNELNKSLLMYYWIIVDRYKIQDYYRVVEDDMIHLIERLKDTNSARRFAFLKSTEDKYRFLPVYWYHRGRAAYENGKNEDALNSLNEFQKYQRDFVKILRYDKTAVSVAMLKTNIMLRAPKGTYSDKEFEEQLQIIERNATKNDWQFYYYAALVYSQKLKKYKKAEELLLSIIDEMEFLRDNNLIDWKEFLQARMDSDDAGLSGGKELHGNDALFSCKSLLRMVGSLKLPKEEFDKQIIEMCEADNTATREKLYCYCSLDCKGALKYLEKDIKGIRFEYDTSISTQSCINVALPVAWVIGREGDMSLYCRDKSTEDKNYLSSANITKGLCLVEDVKSRKIMSVDKEEKVVLRFVPESGSISEGEKIIVLVMRYDRGLGESYQVAVQCELGTESGYIKPSWEGFGKWIKGDRVGSDDIISKWGNNACFKEIEW